MRELEPIILNIVRGPKTYRLVADDISGKTSDDAAHQHSSTTFRGVEQTQTQMFVRAVVDLVRTVVRRAIAKAIVMRYDVSWNQRVPATKNKCVERNTSVQQLAHDFDETRAPLTTYDFNDCNGARRSQHQFSRVCFHRCWCDEIIHLVGESHRTSLNMPLLTQFVLSKVTKFFGYLGQRPRCHEIAYESWQIRTRLLGRRVPSLA